MLENKNLFYEINEILKPDNCEGKLVALGYRAGLGKKRIFTEIMLSSVEVNNSETLLFLFEPPINGALNRILMGSSLFDERLQKIHIDYTPDPDINYIEKTISQFENLNAVFIDCINLINDFQTGKQAEILSRLKEVCKKKNIHIVYAFRLATRMKTYCKVRPTIEDIDEIICDYADAIFVLYRYGIYICDDPIVEYRMMENMHGSLMEIPIYSDDTNLLSYCNKESLPDNAPIKRVELSVQTKMSNDISTISVRDAFDFAIKNNHKAIAFTNYNNVQDFPEIQSIAKEHSELKVIYGTTLLYENDNGGPMAITLLIKNQQGVKNLYKIISSMSETFFDTGIVHINSIERYRENLLCGATGDLSDLFLALKEKKSQSQILSIAKKYDYFVLYPTDDLNTRSIYQQIVELGKKLHIPVIASGDCHYYYKKDEICICVVKGICEINDQQYLRNTEEMLKAFGFLGDEDAYEVVVKNTNLIADSIDNVIPLRDDSPTFDMPNADSCILTESTKKAASIYGTVLPDIIQNRLNTELNYIIQNKFSSVYMLSHLIAKYANDNRIPISVRSPIGSSFVAFLLGITNVNPLQPHYYCQNCKYTDFIFDTSIYCGYDLPTKKCPICGAKLVSDGYNIPLEDFMQYNSNKFPEINMHCPTSLKNNIIKHISDIFGNERVLVAGTIYGLDEQTANVYLKIYEENSNEKFDSYTKLYIKNKIQNIKHRESVHPSGVFILPESADIYDYTPIKIIQDDAFINRISHLDFEALRNKIYNISIYESYPLEILNHLQTYYDDTHQDIDYNATEIFELFKNSRSIGIDSDEPATLGIPGFDTEFARNIIKEMKPKCFADLVEISRLSNSKNIFLKTHSVESVKLALTFAWYKIYYPAEFYTAIFNTYFLNVKYGFLLNGIEEIENNINGIECSNNTNSEILLLKECAERGIKFRRNSNPKKRFEPYSAYNGEILLNY